MRKEGELDENVNWCRDLMIETSLTKRILLKFFFNFYQRSYPLALFPGPSKWIAWYNTIRCLVAENRNIVLNIISNNSYLRLRLYSSETKIKPLSRLGKQPGEYGENIIN